MKKFIILFSFYFFGFSLYSQSVTSLNRAGLRSLNEGKIEESINYFHQSLKLSPFNAFAHYNLACTLSVRLKENYCDYQSDISKIYNHISQATKKKSSYKLKMLNDPDFEALQKEYKFYELASLSLKNLHHQKLILHRVHWFGPTQGIFGPKDGWIFDEKDGFQYWVMELDSNEKINKKIYKGKYHISNTGIQLQFQRRVPGFKSLKYRAKIFPGSLQIQGIRTIYTDDNQACSA
jgi:hypothetical protein